MGLVLLVLGAGAGAAGAAQAAGGGFFTSPAARLVSTSAALVTDEVDVQARRPGNPSPDAGDLGRLRLRVDGSSPGVPLFVGIGPKQAVDRYLHATAHDEMRSFEVNPFRVSFARHPGGARATAPGLQDFWVAQAVGSGRQDLEWDKRGGAWSAVVMRADGRPGVTATADVGLRFGFLVPLGLAAAVTGALLVSGTCIGTLVRARRPRRRT